VEADFLVNIFEDNLGREAREEIGIRIVKTETVKDLLRILYLDLSRFALIFKKKRYP